jgi:hypothetical protein
MKPIHETERPEPAKSTSPVLVLFENDAARNQAVKFCDELIHRFWSQHEIEVTWCSFGSLCDSSNAQQCSSKATHAEVVIVAASGQVPPDIQSWIDRWIELRGEREGALVNVCASGEEPASGTQLYLRHVAHRAGMDYLTQLPQTLSWCIPDSPDSYRQRAHETSSVLDEILRHQPMTQGGLGSFHP